MHSSKSCDNGMQFFLCGLTKHVIVWCEVVEAGATIIKIIGVQLLQDYCKKKTASVKCYKQLQLEVSW
jgi:hypothetical protein